MLFRTFAGMIDTAVFWKSCCLGLAYILAVVGMLSIAFQLAEWLSRRAESRREMRKKFDALCQRQELTKNYVLELQSMVQALRRELRERK